MSSPKIKAKEQRQTTEESTANKITEPKPKSAKQRRADRLRELYKAKGLLS